MADSAAYEHVAGAIEQETSLDRLEARGTVRIALKQSGLDPRNVTSAQMEVVLARVLPSELTARGVEDSQSVCAAVGRGLGSIGDEETGDSPEAIFDRLGGKGK